MRTRSVRTLMALSMMLGANTEAAEPLSATGMFDVQWVRTPAKDTTIGGADAAVAVFPANVALIERLVLSPQDIREASLTLPVVPAQREQRVDGPIELLVYRLNRPTGEADAVSRDDYDREPVMRIALDAIARGESQVITLDGLADASRRMLLADGAEKCFGLVLAIRSTGYSTPAVKIKATRELTAQLSITNHPKHALFDNQIRPRDGVFAAMRDGHLYYGGQRLRLWGVVGYPDPQRLVNMGFNAQRVWAPYARDMYDADSAKRGVVKPPVQGDGSSWDKANQHLKELRDVGCFAMLGGAQDTIPINLVAVDGSFVSGGDDWQAWKAAVTSDKLPKEHDLKRGPLFFDERLQRIKKQHVKNLLTYVNPYTNKPIGQHEHIVVYEIFNENGGVKHILEGSYQRWPEYFQTKFQKRWNDFLKQRYKTDAALRNAWGRLEEGESLARGAIRPGPSFQQRSGFPRQRGNDFVEFVVRMVDAFHQDFRSYCRTLAPKGVGVNVAPFSFDTHYRPSIAWNFLQSRGDVNSFGMYFWDLNSVLDKPPAAYVMDSNTVDGAATIIYETNVGRPNPARAEYPLKLAALAGWQDWDGVFWHYWHRGAGSFDEGYMTASLRYGSKDHYWNAVHHQDDPVMCSTMAAAGRMFLNAAIDPAASPQVVEVRRDALFSYDNYNGVAQPQQTFSTGSRTRYLPDQPGGVTANGKPRPEPQRITEAVRSGEQILWDWPNGRLIVDTPTAKGYAGRWSGTYRFSDGIALSDVGSEFVSFFLVSKDGKPLTGANATSSIYITAVADARNTGFDVDWSVKGGPAEVAKAIRSRGVAPVQVDRVPYTLWLPTQIEGEFKGYDFARREVVVQSLSTTNRITHDGRDLFMGVLEIRSRGNEAATPQSVATRAAPGGESAGVAKKPVQGADDQRFHPIPQVSWSDSYHDAHATLRNALYVFTSISPASPDAAGKRQILVSDAQIASLWSAAADIEIDFDDNRMSTVTVTFRQPPAFEEAVKDYAKQFGEPAEQKLGQQFENSFAAWPATEKRPAIRMTESQGIFKIIYSLAR